MSESPFETIAVSHPTATAETSYTTDSPETLTASDNSAPPAADVLASDTPAADPAALNAATVYSMTGYARVSGRISDLLGFTLTLKSINHRYLDLQMRLPAGTEVLETALRRVLKEKLVRGHVECVLTLERNRPGSIRELARAETSRQALLDLPPAIEASAGGLLEAGESAPAGIVPAVANGNAPNCHVAAPRGPAMEVRFNQAAVAAYAVAFRATARAMGFSGEPNLNEIARLPGMLVVESPASTPGEDRAQQVADDAALAAGVLGKLDGAIAALQTMRAEEGRALSLLLDESLARLLGMVEEVAALREGVQNAHYQRLSQRLESLLSGSFDRDRVLQEAALLAERSDVEEEIARLTTHIAHFRALLAGGGELGKRLDFLLQEMNREANTLLSKTSGVVGHGTRITECGLAMKAEIEKAREQVQNIE